MEAKKVTVQCGDRFSVKRAFSREYSETPYIYTDEKKQKTIELIRRYSFELGDGARSYIFGCTLNLFDFKKILKEFNSLANRKKYSNIYVEFCVGFEGDEESITIDIIGERPMTKKEREMVPENFDE